MIYRLSEIDLARAFERVAPRWAGELVIAIGVLAIIVGLRLSIDVVAPNAAPFILMYPGILLATVAASWRAGAITATLGGLLTWYFVIPPDRSFAIVSAADAVSLILYVLSATFIVVIADAFKASARTVTAERAALAESEARFRRMAEDAPVNLWVADADGKTIYMNRLQRRFWGAGDDDYASFDWKTAAAPEDVQRVADALCQGYKRQEAFDVEARYIRADGASRTLLTLARPRWGGDGAFRGMIGVNVDVTDEREAHERQTLLLNELNHRVKNTLATVQSLARQSLRTDDPKASVQVFDARLLALSAAHDVLTRERWEAAALSEVVNQAILPYQAEGGERFALDGPAVRVPPRVVLGLSMALHELATNAVKYGALSSKAGQVVIRWSNDGQKLELEWRESGGPKVTKPARQGFGSRLLSKGLSGDLGSSPKLDYHPDGVVCRFNIALEAA